MKKIILYVSLLFISSFVFADLAGYTITNYDIEMSLHEDGSMDVKEAIDVNFSEARRGIYRTIPFYSPSGRYTIVQNLGATGDPASSYIEGNNYQLRIGDPNRTMVGSHTYNINYTVYNAIAGFQEGSSERTELYRNIIGTEWATTIDSVGFTLHLPKEIAFSSDDYYVLYGKAGKQKTEKSRIALVGDSKIIGGMNAKLSANEGLTIGVRFPADYFRLTEEYVAIAGESKRASLSTRAYCRTLIASLIEFLSPLLIIVVFMIVARISTNIGRFFRNLRERQIAYSKIGKPVTIYYTPPKGVELPTAARIYDVEPARTFAALIYERIAKGYVTLETKTPRSRLSSASYQLHKKDLSAIQGVAQMILGRMFSLQNKFDLSIMDYHKLSAYKKDRQERELTQPDLGSRKSKIVGTLFPSIKVEFDERGKQLYEELRGFAYFLAHVEEPRLKQMLKEDPQYVDKVLPRAVLFGVETNFVYHIEKITGKPYHMELSTHSFVTYIAHRTVKPAPRSSTSWGSGGGGRSGFSGGGGRSGGGGGGGGGGSW